MSTITQCPECGARFKASHAQIEAYYGMVRCGQCHAAFNAIKHQISEEQSPQLDLPIELEEFIPPPALEPPSAESIPHAEPAEALAPPLAEKPTNAVSWPLALGVLILLLLLLAQALYFFRVEIAARLPGLKPVLAAYCGVLHCVVPLPHNADLMSIESSSLEADPARANAIVLSVTLRNHASYAQALPELELTLNDINDRAVARRIFHPSEYVPNGYDPGAGLAGNREINVRINLDVATDLKAAGYRLLLTYPQP